MDAAALGGALGASRPGASDGQAAGQSKGLNAAPAQGAQCCGQANNAQSNLIQQANLKKLARICYMLFCWDTFPESEPPPPPAPPPITGSPDPTK